MAELVWALSTPDLFLILLWYSLSRFNYHWSPSRPPGAAQERFYLVTPSKKATENWAENLGSLISLIFTYMIDQYVPGKNI